MDIDKWGIFIIASLALAFAPGPGMLYVLSRAIAGGPWAGVASTLGAALGGYIHVILAALGVSAILVSSETVFTIAKYLGAIFLMYLGYKMILSCRGLDKVLNIDNLPASINLKVIFYQGVVTELLNPKTVIFFVSFIPQFINYSNENIFMQFIVLGSIVVLINTIPDFIISWLSKPIEKLWKLNKKFRVSQLLVSGFCLVGLGGILALTTI